jgi:hypothetical protein
MCERVDYYFCENKLLTNEINNPKTQMYITTDKFSLSGKYITWFRLYVRYICNYFATYQMVMQQ